MDLLRRIEMNLGMMIAWSIRHSPVILKFVTAVAWASIAAGNESKFSTLIQSSCFQCHSGENPDGLFSVDQLPLDASIWRAADLDTRPWERILRKLRAGQMPPPSHEQPDAKLLLDAMQEIGKGLEEHDQLFPIVATVPGLRRLTRTEYQNAVRDLLGVSIDASLLLPKDESSNGFDNITVGELTPAFIGRAVQSAQQISRLVLGIQELGPAGITVRVPPDRTQESHLEGLPLGTRGGTLFDYHFPKAGDYEFQMRLMRDRDEKIEGLSKATDLDILIDRTPRYRFSIPKPPNPEDHTLVDANLRVRFHVDAGIHQVGVTFPAEGSSLLEIKRQPFDASYNRHRHPRSHPALYEVSIVGPIDSTNSGIPRTPVTESLFAGAAFEPTPGQQELVAREILSRLARRAYRRPITQEDMILPMQLFAQSVEARGFIGGLEAGIAAILVNPNFLLRIEVPEKDNRTSFSKVVPVADIELASRLSFFLWSSIPDEELLGLAEQGRLREPRVLTEQVDRMLNDARSESLITNFASQWLYLRNLSSLSPDLRLYPDFDDNLRTAMREETESLLREVLRNNQSVLTLIRSDHTFVNERLAVHYGIPGILGSDVQRIDSAEQYRRGGILRHASILAVTSYATRTSPTIRGNWILENILGTPPPPPPPNVPALRDKSASQPTSTRQLLDLHRSNPSCAACHDLMDPVGFALENYDALGRWREWEGDAAIDASGVLPDGSKATTVSELEASILKRPEAFVGTLVEKLLTYGLGRGAEIEDGPQVRKIVRESAEHDYRFHSLIQAIVHSRPFLMKRSE